MTERKKQSLVFLAFLIILFSFLFCFILFLIIDIDKFFIFLFCTLIFVAYASYVLIIFFYLHKFNHNIKNELKVLNQKEKAVKDFYRYEIYLNPPELNN